MNGSKVTRVSEAFRTTSRSCDRMAEVERREQLPEDLEHIDEFGFRQLHWACADGNSDSVKDLLERGADIRALVADRKATPLHIAAEYEKEDVVRILLEKLQVSDLEVRDHEGDTPLHIAAGNLSILQLMLEKHPQRTRRSFLRGIRNNKRQTLLHYAAGKGSAEVVAFLLKEKVDALAKDHKGATPFHFGARGGSVPVMKKLITYVDDTNDDGLTALHYAAWNGHEEVVKWLLRHGAKISIPDGFNGDTPLHWAARNGSANAINILLEKGADMSATNSKDELPLNVATQSAVSTIFNKMISSASFDPLMHRNNGTLLHYVACYGSKGEVESVLKKIREHTARKKDGKEENYVINVNLTDKQGQNAFHWAASKGNTSVIETLKRENVNPSAKDLKNRSPLRVALIENQLQFAGALLKCLGENLAGELLSNTINEEINVDFINSFRVHITGSHSKSNEEIINEIPAIYKILHANIGKSEGIGIAKFVHENNKGIFEFVNSKGKITGRTALHWASILKQKSIVSMLCRTEEISANLIADRIDNEGKTPLEYATTEVGIVKELMKRPEVQAHVKTLYKEQKVYQDFSNAILVGATMIVGITFEWSVQIADINSPVIWVSNFSLFFSFVAVFVGISAMFPVSEYSKLAEAVKRARWASIGAALCLAASFFLNAAAAAAFYAYPSSVWFPLLCLFFLGSFFSWQRFFKKESRRALPEHSPSPSLYQNPVGEDGPSTGTTIYKFGNRHAYIPWEDGLDNLREVR